MRFLAPGAAVFLFLALAHTASAEEAPTCSDDRATMTEAVGKALGSVGRSAKLEPPVIRDQQITTMIVDGPPDAADTVYYRVLTEPDVGASVASATPTVDKEGKQVTTIGILVPKVAVGGTAVSISVAACSRTNRTIVWASRRSAWLSSWTSALWISLLATAVLYLMVAIGRRQRWSGQTRSTLPNGGWIAALNPFEVARSISGGTSLSNLQLLAFSLVFFWILLFTLLRTGSPADIPINYMWLLGIVGIGSVTTWSVARRQSQLGSDDLAWLTQRGWTRDESVLAALLTRNGEFDPSRLQALAFGSIVLFLLIHSTLIDVTTISIPDGLLGLLLASQAVYVGGRWVKPDQPKDMDAEFAGLRDIIDTARKAEFTLIAKLPAGTKPEQAAGILQSVAPVEYADYVGKLAKAADKFEDLMQADRPRSGIFGIPVPPRISGTSDAFSITGPGSAVVTMSTTSAIPATTNYAEVIEDLGMRLDRDEDLSGEQLVALTRAYGQAYAAKKALGAAGDSTDLIGLRAHVLETARVAVQHDSRAKETLRTAATPGATPPPGRGDLEALANDPELIALVAV